jgi:hypothetical protein
MNLRLSEQREPRPGIGNKAARAPFQPAELVFIEFYYYRFLRDFKLGED